MSDTVHLVVVRGRDVGMRISVPDEGARVGRSSKNDLVLVDPLMSRHHARLSFRDGVLWLTDLGSANASLVNDRPVGETRLHVGDRVTLGDTILKVIHDGKTGEASLPTGAPPVDLGLGKKPEEAVRKPIGIRPLLIVTGCVVLIALAVWAPRLLRKSAVARPAPAPREAPPPSPGLTVDYEKVEATPDNIFRYHLHLSDDNVLSVQIDDLAEDRHVRKEGHVDPEYIGSLAMTLADSGFFMLDPEYRGIQPDILDSRDLSIIVGRRAHRVLVINRVEPDLFRSVRETIEEFGKNELGLWAIQFSPEKLVQMASDALLLGRKLFDEREIRYGNLADALAALDEAAWFLETVEPKPDFYGDILAARNDAETELQKRYNDHNFRAERAIRLRDWTDAAAELRILCELVPSRDDARHTAARRKLLDVERRLDTER